MDETPPATPETSPDVELIAANPPPVLTHVPPAGVAFNEIFAPWHSTNELVLLVIADGVVSTVTVTDEEPPQLFE